jgi:hypothetical protein
MAIADVSMKPSLQLPAVVAMALLAARLAMDAVLEAIGKSDD